MADDFKFGLEIDVSDAIASLNKVNNRIERMTGKKNDNNNIISQKDFNNVLRDLDTANKKVNQLNDEIKESRKSPSKSLPEAMQIARAIQEAKELNAQLSSITSKYRKFQDGARISPSPQYDSYKNTVGEERSTYRGIGQNNKVAITRAEYADRGRDVTRQRRSTEQYSRQIDQGGYISHKDYQQALELNKELQKVRFTGIDEHRSKISSKEDRLQGIDKYVGDLKRKESKGGLSDAEKKSMNSHIEESKQIMEELKIMEQFQVKMEKSVENLDAFNHTLETVKNIKPERGTTRGMMYERAPSIAMGAMAVFGGTIASKLTEGTGIKEGMLADNLSVGTQTGNYDYHQVRKNAGVAGFDKTIGMSETEMLQAQASYMNSAGFQGQEDLTQSAKNTGTFARGMGITIADSSATTENLGRTMQGANASSIKGIQQAFAGGLKESGMVGQAQQQLSALNSVVEGIGQARGLSSDDLNRFIGMQSALAGTGSKSLQGEAGSDFMNTLDSGLVGAQTDGTVIAMMAQQDPSRYGGVGGYYQAQADLSDGLSGKGLKNVMDSMDTMTKSTYGSDSVGSDNYINTMRGLMNSKLGTDMSTDQAKGFLEVYNSGEAFDADGKLSSEVAETFKLAGEDIIKKGSEGYSESDTASEKSYKDSMESVATATSDLASEFKGLVAPTMMASGAFGTLIIATTALVGAFLTASASMGIGSLIRGGVAGKGPKAGGAVAGGAVAGGAGGKFASVVDTMKDKVKGNPAGTASLARSVTAGSATTAGASAGAKGIMSKVPILGTVATVGFGGMALHQINKEDKVNGVEGAEHNAKVGKVIGETGGALAGAGAGASIGAGVGALFGGVGAIPGSAIGGIIGGIGGMIGGSKGGGKLGEWVGGMFGGDKKKAVDSKTDEATTAKKKEVEEKRARNIQDEKDLVNGYNNKSSGPSSSSNTQGTEYNRSMAEPSKATTEPPVNTTQNNTNKTKTEGTVKGDITVTHTGKVSSDGKSETDAIIGGINNMITGSFKAQLPNGNETKTT